jgi:hypothetical protein
MAELRHIINFTITVFFLSLISLSGTAAPLSCRAALDPSFSERILEFRVQKKRGLTEFEVDEVLEKGIQSLTIDIDEVSNAFKDNPDAITLLHEIEMINVGTDAVLGRAKALSKMMEPGRIKKMFQKEEVRKIKMQELAEEIRVCRSQTEHCMTEVQGKVTAVIEAAHKMGELITRIDAVIEELGRASLSLNDSNLSREELLRYQTEITAFVSRLQLAKSAFEGYLAAVENGFPTLHDAGFGFKTLVDTLALIAERGAPSIVTQTLSVDDLRAQHEAKLRLKFLTLVSPKVIKIVEGQNDPDKLADSICSAMHVFSNEPNPSFSDADILYMLQKFPLIQSQYDVAGWLFHNSSILSSTTFRPKRLLPDKEWIKAIDIFDVIVDHYKPRDEYKRQQLKMAIRRLYARSMSGQRPTEENP